MSLPTQSISKIESIEGRGNPAQEFSHYGSPSADLSELGVAPITGRPTPVLGRS